MSAKFWIWAVIFIAAASVAGCGAIPEEHEGAAVGAGAGAATGAAAGAILGESAEATIIGGILGGLVGGAVGHYAYDQTRDRRETARAYDYDKSRGSILAIENASAVPDSVDPGKTVDIKMTYALLNPEEPATVSEIREVTHDGELVANPQVTVERTAGTYTSELPIHLPDNASKGLYRVKTTVKTENASDTRMTDFVVQ